MISEFEKVMCVGKPAPREWKLDDGRSGVTYKIKISDGADSLELPCVDADVWDAFVPLGWHRVELETTQVAQDSRISTRSRVVRVESL